MTSFALFGERPAFAVNPNQPRVEAAGWIFFHPDAFDLNNPCNSGCEVKFGVTANYTGTGTIQPQGRFEYFNTVTGLNVHGKITYLQTGVCTGAGAPITTKTPLEVKGTCDDGNNCAIDVVLVDGGPGGKGDFVCNIMVGVDKNNNADADSATAEPLIRGNINIQQLH